MSILTPVLLLFSGIIAAKYFIKSAGLPERLGIVIFSSLTFAPFLNINYAFFTNRRISNELTVLTSIILIVLFSILLFLKRKGKNTGTIKSRGLLKKDLPVLTIALLFAIFFSYYYTNKEFLLSLGSYLIKGDANCFYMQTFDIVRNLSPDLKWASHANNPYEIICTPGNILFTSTILPIFKIYSFRADYVLFLSLLFIFTYLLAHKLLNNRVIALAAAVFSVINPYLLSVEVLDRNVIVLTLSAILFYLVVEHKYKTFFHGLVFGVMAGTGLRFLPLLFVIPVIILYYRSGLKIKECLSFIPAFIIAFTFNIPHLFFHGFNSLGETSSSLNLILKAFMEWKRTPFLPFPNLLFYVFNILNYFGYLASGIILAGVFRLWKTDRKLSLALSLFFLSVLFILTYQRNWIEGDKYRIIISSFLPLYIFFAYGLKYLFEREYPVKKIVALTLCFIMPALLIKTLSGVNFPEDAAFYERKPLYQTESRNYHSLTKGFLSDVRFLPNYKRLFYKLDLKDKAKEEQIVFERLFPEGELSWGKYFSGKNVKGADNLSESYSYVRIDFDKLASKGQKPVNKIDKTDICAIDLSDKDNLFDAYYAGLNVSWQKEPLPVSVILYEEDITYLKELSIDLNAFLGLGKDEAGFDVIYPINFKTNLLLKESGSGAGMSSFPLFSEQNSMVFKVPDDLRIVIRNWFINEKGIPYKVDSWCISQDKNGNYKSEFFYNEPESYL